MVTAAHHALFTVQDFEGSRPRPVSWPVSLVVRTSSSTRACTRWRASACCTFRPFGAVGGGVGNEAGVPVAVGVEQGGLLVVEQGAAAHDDVHGGRPVQAGEPFTEQVGDLAALQAVNDLSGGVGQAWQPPVVRAAVARGADVLVDVEPDGVGHLSPGYLVEAVQPADQRVRRAGTVTGDQQIAAPVGGDLRDRGAQHVDEVFGGVGSGRPRPGGASGRPARRCCPPRPRGCGTRASS